MMERSNFIWLTVALLGMMIAGGIAEDLPDNWAVRTLEWTSIGMMLISLMSLRTHRRWAKRIVVLTGFMLIFVVARDVTKNSYIEYVYLLTLLMFFCMASWIVGRQVLLTGTVDVNKIVGSVALYIMIGLIWSLLYTLLLEYQPDAMKGFEAGMWYQNMSTMTYFSFVTLTTLGYGDISPLTSTAQTLVVIEAITGMFYLAIIVASLVGSLKNKV